MSSPCRFYCSIKLSFCNNFLIFKGCQAFVNDKNLKKGVDFFKNICYNIKCRAEAAIYAGMAELADAYGSGPYGRKAVQVQVLLPAPINARSLVNRCGGVQGIFCWVL